MWLSCFALLIHCPSFSYLAALGSILEAPVQTTAPLGANATFRCTVVGRIFWELDNVQILTEDLVAGQRGVNRYVPLSTANHSEAVLTATFMNNGTVVQCHVEEFEVVGPPLLLNSSEEVSLLVFGEFLSMGQALEWYWWRCVMYIHCATPFLCMVCFMLMLCLPIACTICSRPLESISESST